MLAIVHESVELAVTILTQCVARSKEAEIANTTPKKNSKKYRPSQF